MNYNYLVWVLILAFLASECLAHGDSSQSEVQEENQERFPTVDYVMQLNGDNLQEALDEFSLILIKFYAPWCGHCKTLAPIYKDLARTMSLGEESSVQVAEIDCTVSQEACGKHGIRGYPTLKYFIDGEAYQYSGHRQHDALVEWLNNKPLQVRGQKQAEQM